MALIDTNSSYHYVTRVDFSKSNNIRISIKDYQTKEIRESPGKYDPVFENHVGIQVSSADQATLYEIFYRNLKAKSEYSEMEDDL